VQTLLPEKNRRAITVSEETPSGPLDIQTDPPGLEVLIDGKSAGVSPLTLLLPIGSTPTKSCRRSRYAGRACNPDYSYYDG